MLEKESDRENNVNLGSFSHYKVNLQNTIKVLDIIWQLVMPDSPPLSVLSTKCTVMSLALPQFGPYVTAQFIWAFQVRNMENTLPDTFSVEINRFYIGSAIWHVMVFMISYKTKFK